MRSASSSTSVLSASSCRLPRSRWSSTRPGVPTTMCAPCSRLAVWPRSGTPPHSVTTLMLSSARARRRISVRHLVGQLARGAQHQRLHGEAARVQVGQQRQREGGGLAAAGLGLRDQVLAQQGRRQAGRLDGRHLVVAERCEVLQGGGGQGKSGEAVLGRLGHGPIIPQWREARWHARIDARPGYHAVQHGPGRPHPPPAAGPLPPVPGPSGRHQCAAGALGHPEQHLPGTVAGHPGHGGRGEPAAAADVLHRVRDRPRHRRLDRGGPGLGSEETWTRCGVSPAPCCWAGCCSA